MQHQRTAAIDRGERIVIVPFKWKRRREASIEISDILSA